MRRRALFTRRASQQVAANYDWLTERSRRAADRWRDSLLAAIDTLATDAGRHPRTDHDTGDRDIRQMLHGRRRSVYRVLYEIVGDTVTVHRVLHATQDDPDPTTF